MKTHANEHGYSLAEVMIALGVLVILGLIVMQIYQSVLVDTRRQQLASTRDQIVILIRQSASNLQGLRNSLKQPGNEQFYTCVCGQAAVCNSGQTYPFKLFDLPVAPPTEVPLYYDTSGIPCDKNAPNCLIEVTMNFIPQCMPTLPAKDPSPPPFCSGQPVELFGIVFKVQQNQLTASQGVLLKPISGTAYTQVANLVSSSPGVCP